MLRSATFYQMSDPRCDTSRLQTAKHTASTLHRRCQRTQRGCRTDMPQKIGLVQHQSKQSRHIGICWALSGIGSVRGAIRNSGQFLEGRSIARDNQSSVIIVLNCTEYRRVPTANRTTALQNAPLAMVSCCFEHEPPMQCLQANIPDTAVLLIGHLRIYGTKFETSVHPALRACS